MKSLNIKKMRERRRLRASRKNSKISKLKAKRHKCRKRWFQAWLSVSNSTK